MHLPEHAWAFLFCINSQGTLGFHDPGSSLAAPGGKAKQRCLGSATFHILSVAGQTVVSDTLLDSMKHQFTKLSAAPTALGDAF